MVEESSRYEKACPCCGTIVSPKNVATPNSLGGCCPLCGHFNVLRHDTLRLPVGPSIESLGGVAPRSLPDSGDHVATLRYLGLVYRSLLMEARSIVGADRPAATAFLLELVARREALLQEWFVRGPLSGAGRSGSGQGAEDSWDATTTNKVIQLVYLMLAERGDTTLSEKAAAAPTGPLHAVVWPLLSDATVIAQLISHSEAGLLRLELVDGEVLAEKTDAHSMYQEEQLNLRRVEARFKERGDPLDEPEYYEAQETLLGFSLRDVLMLWAGGSRKLKEATTVSEQGGVQFIRTGGLAPRLRGVLDAMTLSVDRVRRFRVPFYFDLGPRREPAGDDLESDVDACQLNWSTYYPLLAASDRGAPVAVTSTRAVQAALVNAYAVRSNMLAQLVEASKRGGADEARVKVRALASASWARIEADIASAAREQGWAALASIKSVGGRLLPGGEVDVLVGRAVKGELVLVLLECKDVDLPIWKPGSMERISGTLARAAAQVERKVAWLLRGWRDAGKLLGLPPAPSGAITSMVVTRRYVLPGLVTGPAVVPKAAVPEVLARVALGNTGPWEGFPQLRVHRVP